MVPQVLSLVLHFAGGYLIADAADRLGAAPEAGVVVSAVVGVAKEVSDLNFNVPDALAWPLGAAYYRLGKAHPEWCYELPPGYRETYWYQEIPQCPSPAP